MLSFFKIRRNFHKLTVSLTVDGDAKTAEVVVSYDRRIVRIEEIPFDLVSTGGKIADVAKAEAWLSRPCGERGNYVEALEWACRTGVLTREAA